MKADDILNLVRDMTQHKADDRIDFDALLLLRMQKFVQRKRYWWRQRVISFNTVASTDTYDLSSDTVMGTGLGKKDIQKFAALKLMNGAEVVSDINPVFDHTEKMILTQQTDTGDPDRYFWEPGQLYTIRLCVKPASARKVVGTYWWVPSGATESDDMLDDALGGIPEGLHHAVVDGLNMDVKLFLYGAKDGEYQAAQAQYVESCEAADMDRDYSDGEVEEFKSQEAAVNASTSRS